MRVDRLVFPAALVVLLGAGRAGAEPQPPWLERFDVLDECPAAGLFVDAVSRRVSQPLEQAFAGLRLRVSIAREPADGGGLLGQLHVAGSPAGESTRSVRARSCAELIEALSLVAALGADAGRRRTRDAPLSAPSAGVARTDPLDAPPAPSASSLPEVFRLGPTAYLLLQDSATPRPELGVGLALSLSWPKRAGWSPWLQLGAYRLESGAEPVGSGSIQARFELTAAHLVACPVRLLASPVWSLQPCAELDLGQLRGTGGGSAIERPSQPQGLWASSALSLRLELDPWDPLRFSASLGAVLPWTRHEFFFAPDVVAFHVPDLGFRATFSGAVMF